MMYRYCLSATMAIGLLLNSGCSRHDGILPKTDRNTTSQAPASDHGSRDAGATGQAGAHQY